MNIMEASKFSLGEVVMTAGVAASCLVSELLSCLARHGSMDWGDLCASDAKANDCAVKNGGRILSSYRLAKDEKIWIITEADRSVTTILFPSEY